MGKLALAAAAFALLMPTGAQPREAERLAPATPPRAVVGVPYSHQFESAGQADPVFSTGNPADLPDGLSLGEDGLLSGVPTRAGHHFFVVYAADAGSEGTSQHADMDVVAPPRPALTEVRPYAATEAHLHGLVEMGNLPAEAWFEYWSGDSPPQRTPVEQIGAVVGPWDVRANVAGLVPGIDYSYRLAVTSDLSPDPVYSGTETQPFPLPPPKAGQTFNVEPVDGRTGTRCGEEQSFTKLNRPKQVTLDCEIDAVDGTVAVTASKGGDQTQTANFWGGVFGIDQEAGDNREAVLSLVGDRRCEKKRSGQKHRVGLRARKGRGGRKLWGSGSGNYKTVGGHGAATVRGTIWLVSDRCDGSTLFKVKRGTVVVRDFVKQATVVLEAGESYVAKVDVGRLP